MGAHLIGEVFTRWTHVSDRAFRVLVRMALTALDEPNGKTPAGLYFAGRDLLAMALRPDWPEGDDDASREQRKRVLQILKLALRELVKVGAIERVGAAYTGQQMTYRLTLGTLSTSERGGTPRTPSGGKPRTPSRAERGDATHREGVSHVPPEDPEEPTDLEELSEEEVVDLRTDLSVPRASPPEDPDQISIDGEEHQADAEPATPAGSNPGQERTGGDDDMARDRGNAQTHDAPTSDRDRGAHCANCGTFYIDDDGGHESHRVVFGHTPRRLAPVDGEQVP